MRSSSVYLAAGLTIMLAAAAPAPGAAAPARQGASTVPDQRTYATAEQAAAGLADAIRARDAAALLAVIGPRSESWLRSADRTQDLATWKRFLELYDAQHVIVRDSATRATLTVGHDHWPFPAPLVKSGERWHFDAEAGREEVLKRRIGRNELDTIQTLLAIVDAQHEYALLDPENSGMHPYAARFMSTLGRKDGLYWQTNESEPVSPLGALVAAAAAKGYLPSGNGPRPYNGYLFRILTAQGAEAAGGPYDYLVRDRLIGGFAVIAWPARYGNTGIMTFMVNHDGVVYEKDLGEQTTARAANITQFNPDDTWTRSVD